ncbi:MAG: hypothetical protein K6A43_01350 [Treponema sp.]|nr:hypothetical protein [Treponema sp.]
MRNKQKVLFNALQSNPEFQNKDCKKAANKLMSSITQADKVWKLASICEDKVYKEISRLCVKLQKFTSDEEILSALRSTQGYYHCQYRRYLHDYEADELIYSAVWGIPDSFSDD